MKTKVKTIAIKTVRLYGKRGIRYAELYDRGFALPLAGLIYLSISAFFWKADLLRMAYSLAFGLGLTGLFGVTTFYRSLFAPEALHQKSNKQIW